MKIFISQTMHIYKFINTNISFKKIVNLFVVAQCTSSTSSEYFRIPFADKVIIAMLIIIINVVVIITTCIIVVALKRIFAAS